MNAVGTMKPDLTEKIQKLIKRNIGKEGSF